MEPANDPRALRQEVQDDTKNGSYPCWNTSRCYCPFICSRNRDSVLLGSFVEESEKVDGGNSHVSDGSPHPHRHLKFGKSGGRNLPAGVTWIHHP